jgi:LacI family transcriptional regulator
MRKKNITLDDIAQILKISKVSVSKALRNHADISLETKKLVQETAAQLGYVPNYMARNLSSQKSNTIGLIVPKIAHHFFAETIEAIYREAYKNNYEVILTVSQEDAAHEIKHIQTLLSMRVDGLLISVTEKTQQHKIFETVRDRGVPLVFFDRVIEDLGFSCVTTDDEEGSYLAVSHVVNAGYKKIAHLAGYRHTNIGQSRLKGFEQAVKDFGLDVPKEWIIEGGFNEVAGHRGLIKLLKCQNKPQVVFTVTYPVALGVIIAAEEMGLKIPDDIDVISFGGSNYNHFIKPSLSFVEQPVQEIGRRAVKMLFSEMENPDSYKPQIVTLPTRIVICETCLQYFKGEIDE